MLTGVSGPQDARYRHDALGRRILRYSILDGKEVYERYFYDGADVIADYDLFGRRCGALYVTPFLDENLMVERHFCFGRARRYWYTQDGLGSVRQLVFDPGKAFNSYSYTAWGVPPNRRPGARGGVEPAKREVLFHEMFEQYAYVNLSALVGTFLARDKRVNANVRDALFDELKREGLAEGPGAYKGWHEGAFRKMVKELREKMKELKERGASKEEIEKCKRLLKTRAEECKKHPETVIGFDRLVEQARLWKEKQVPRQRNPRSAAYAAAHRAAQIAQSFYWRGKWVEEER